MKRRIDPNRTLGGKPVGKFDPKRDTLLEPMRDEKSKLSASEQNKVNIELRKAARKGNKERVEELLDQGADVDAKDDFGGTALMGASWKGHREVAELLIDRGADVNASQDSGFTALMWAAFVSHKGIAQLLIDRGADIEARDNEGKTALMLAAENRKDRPGVAQLLMDRGADIEARDNEGMTALMLAARSGRKKVAKLLIIKGADIEARDNEGMTALINSAAMDNNHKITSLLRNWGFNLWRMDTVKGTVLMWKTEDEIREAMEILIANGADIEARDNEGMTALMHAGRCGHGRKGIVKLLIDNGCNVNAKSNFETTALMITANRFIGDVESLINAGADVHLRDKDGKTAREIAEEGGYQEIAEMLRRAEQ